MDGQADRKAGGDEAVTGVAAGSTYASQTLITRVYPNLITFGEFENLLH